MAFGIPVIHRILQAKAKGTPVESTTADVAKESLEEGNKSFHFAVPYEQVNAYECYASLY